MTDLERQVHDKLVQYCYYGAARTGLGFGKFPLGIEHCLKELVILFPEAEELQKAFAYFQQRMKD